MIYRLVPLSVTLDVPNPELTLIGKIKIVVAEYLGNDI